jgi:lipopolysaccharide transport system ATP-binding protein
MSEPAVRMTNVGKAYKIFPSSFGILLDALGLERLTRYREFWAVRGFDLELAAGQRMGLIGRNGAGKSTLLKLVTQNVQPTEGEVEVNGEVHALFEATGGLHPEFTGHENIRGSLEALGLSNAEISYTTKEIAEFTELGRFLDQPLKTYSLGMQSRLSFAVATAIDPEILIVDEILGAGDAYFFGKAIARMRRLVESGAAVLIVSHALDQIQRFCEETIWLDRGRIVMQGPTTEVVKAYERFIRELEDRRLRARNQSRRDTYQPFEREGSTDELEIRLTGPGEITRLALLRDRSVEDELLVGGPQDADEAATSYVALQEGGWEAPMQEPGRFFRPLPPDAESVAVFGLWLFYPQSEYTLELTYRAREGVRVAVVRDESVLIQAELPAAAEWTTETLMVAEGAADEVRPLDRVSRWPGARGLLMERVIIVGADGTERALLEAGEQMSITVDVVAESSGRFPLIPAALVFRPDGLVVTRHVGDRIELDVEEGDRVQLRLDFGPLLLGNGTYLLSFGLYKQLDVNDTLTSEIYDYFDRSFEFAVTGNPPLHDEVIRHPGEWTVTQNDSARAVSAPHRPGS